jgi:hypothetical protein
MKINTALALALFALFALSSSPVLAADVKVVVPAGIVLETHLIEAMDSSKVHTGDIFEFVVVNDVVVGNYIAISSGSKGVGHVTDAHAAGSHGKSGGIRLTYDYVFANDGTQIPVAHNAEASRADTSSVPALAIGIVTFGVGGLFAHNFVHGHDIVIAVETITDIATLANKAVVLDDAKYAAPLVAAPIAEATTPAKPQ